jgi:prevent-host-death family protein
MVKRLTRTGNSLALVLDRRLLERAKIDAGTLLQVSTDGDAIVISPVRARRRTAGVVAEARGRYEAAAPRQPGGVARVGLRELKAQLSEYVRRARAGTVVLVTDRGHVVAELLPPGSAAARSDEALVALARRGLLTLGAPNTPAAYPRMPRVLPPGSAKRLLDWVRGDR